MPTETIGDWERRKGFERVEGDIASLPETVEPERTAPAVENEPVVLLERSCGGWKTELRLTPDGSVAVLAQQGEDAPIQAVVVAPEKALDAFNHPYCYLPR